MAKSEVQGVGEHSTSDGGGRCGGGGGRPGGSGGEDGGDGADGGDGGGGGCAGEEGGGDGGGRYVEYHWYKFLPAKGTHEQSAQMEQSLALARQEKQA